MTNFSDLSPNPSNVLLQFLPDQVRPPKLDAFEVDENFDPSALPTRPWLIRGLAMNGHLTLILSPGGIGKSTLGIGSNLKLR